MTEKIHPNRKPQIVPSRDLYCFKHGNTEHRRYEIIGYNGSKTSAWKCVSCQKERDRRRHQQGYIPAFKVAGAMDPLPPAKNTCPNCFLETPAGAPCQHCY